jgi:hypothetical protein
MNPYTVIIAYTGECCTDSHVWAKHIDAKDERDAIKKMRRLVFREGNTPHDAAVYPGHLPAPLVVERAE